MKFSKHGILLILATFTFSIGFLAGLRYMGEGFAPNEPGEAFYMSLHTSYLKGCVAMAQESGISDSWDNCVEKARAHVNESREIINQEPNREPAQTPSSSPSANKPRRGITYPGIPGHFTI